RVVGIGRIALEILRASLDLPVERIVIARRIQILLGFPIGLLRIALIGVLRLVALLLIRLLLIGLRLVGRLLIIILIRLRRRGLGLRRQRTRHLARWHLALKFPGGFSRRLAPDIGALHPGRRPRGRRLFGFRRRLRVILFGVIILPQVLWADLLLTDVRLARVPLPDVWLARLL